MRTHVARLAAAVSLIALAACSVSEDKRRLEIGLPVKFLSTAARGEAPQYSFSWWQQFADPTLNRLVEMALAENPTLAEAEARVREAEARARAFQNWPTGNGELNIESSVSDNLALDASWRLSRERQQQALAALARLEAAQYGAETAHQQLTAQVAGAYVELRFLQQLSVLNQRDLRSRSRSLNNLTTLADQGNATRLDVVRAQALLSETRADISQNTGRIAGQKHRIATLLGKPLGLLEVDLASNGVQPLPTRILTAGVPANLVRNKRDVLQAEALYEAALRDLGAARAARYPSLTLSGNILRPLDGTSVASSAVASVALPIFQQPILIAEQDAAEARVEQAYAFWTSSVLTAVEEVEVALSAIQGSSEAVRHSRGLVRLNTEALDLVRQLITLGDATVLELLDAEREVTRAGFSFAETQRDYALNVIRLYRALGVGVGTNDAEIRVSSKN